jgi:hypothetical protein
MLDVDGLVLAFVLECLGEGFAFSSGVDVPQMPLLCDRGIQSYQKLLHEFLPASRLLGWLDVIHPGGPAYPDACEREGGESH